MRITSLKIENFRSIKSLYVELGEQTVFIGPNNSGKTAILDALRIALTRRWGQRGTGFTEYDIHLEKEGDDPKQSSGIAIEIKVEEKVAGEWPQVIQQDLDEISNTDPLTGKASISLSVTCQWSQADKCFQPAWTFLNAARQPFIGASARRTNLEKFWQYLPVFYLGAMRDAEEEFTAKSQFWGRLLKAMQIPAKLEQRVERILKRVNAQLLAADSRLGDIAETLSRATCIAARDRDGQIDVRLIPVKSWDLLSKAEIIVRNEPDWPWLPLQRHGQGVQSLTVIFLFQAFVKQLLGELYAEESVPILALEEPETHLHPQAARTLWANVKTLPGQKLITTHSPYFVQHVPFRDLRLVSLTDKGTDVRWLPATFSATIPHVSELDAVIQSTGSLTYDRAARLLTVAGSLDPTSYRKLLTCYASHPEKAVIHGVLRDLRDRAACFMPDDELRVLETYARRIRGEIFFARRWLFVEGQAEYLLSHALGRGLGYDLDEHGVSVIDTRNNGSIEVFAALARALNIPWLAVVDGDAAGRSYVQAIINRGFNQEFVQERCRILPVGALEKQLLADGFEVELRQILGGLGYSDAQTLNIDQVQARLENVKTSYAAALADRIATDSSLAKRMPAQFCDAINSLRGLQ